MTEQELDRLQNTRFQLEMQVNTLESASFNAENMAAMKKASTALKDIHGKLCVPLPPRPVYAYVCANPNVVCPCSTIDTVDRTMADIQEQTQLASEVSEAISSSTYAGVEIDEVRVPPSSCAPCAPGRVADPVSLCLFCRTRSSRSLPIWNRTSSTTGSWATTCPCTIQQGRAESKTVRYRS